MFELQDEVTTSVIGAIAPKLEQAEIERARHKPTDKLAAYDYYLHGMANIYQGTKDANVEALQNFSGHGDRSQLRDRPWHERVLLCVAQGEWLGH